MERPNFLLIQADDLGYDDLGVHGNAEATTPVLDAWAQGAVRFDPFTVNPVCAPSRATLLTGRHFLRTGVSHVHGGKDFLDRGERTVADLLGAAGYATGMWGKWHLGHVPGYHPWERGFGEAYAARLYKHRATEGRLNGKPVKHERWADEVIVDGALDFIRRHRGSPWLAYVSTMTPHGPHVAPDRWVEHHRSRGRSEALARLWGMVSFLDEQLGRLFAGLEEAGEAENTVVLFMSDNGPAMDFGTLSDEDRALRKVSGRRGWKGDIWENGVRSPLFARCGRKWGPRVVAEPVALEDVVPTFLDLAGAVDVPLQRPLDGRSLRGLLEGGGQGQPERAIFNYSSPGWPPAAVPYSQDGIRDEYRPVTPAARAALKADEQVISVRRGRYKLLMNPEINTAPEGGNRVWLVDLDADPGERRNLAPEEPERAAAMGRELTDWWAGILREPVAFTAPEYVLPLEDGTELTIPAKTACAVHPDLKNTVGVLKGWGASGQWAEYRVHVRENLVMGAPRVVWERAPEWPGRLIVSHGRSRVEGRFEGGQKEVELPPLELDPQAGVLRVELVLAEPPAEGAADAWLNSIAGLGE